MRIINDFNTTVEKAFDEIDPHWRDYEGLAVCGTHSDKIDVESILGEIKAARERKTPFLGICSGFQLAAIEYARNVVGISDACSEEYDSKGTLIVQKLSQLRVGLQKVREQPFTSYQDRYDTPQQTLESHWHNYYVPASMMSYLFTAIPDKKTSFRYSHTDGITEWFYLDDFYLDQNRKKIRVHPFFLGVQYHPEYQSSKDKPHPLLVSFLDYCKNCRT